MTSRRPKQFKKAIVVETKSSIIKDKEPFQGFPFREWSVEVLAAPSSAGQGEKWPLENWIEKVEFKLHESFENPIKTFGEAPYKVQEIGWGEFRMAITIHCKDEISAPVTFLHDLAFQPETNEKLHVINLRPNPKLESAFDSMVGPAYVGSEESGEKENERRKRRSFMIKSESETPAKKKNFDFNSESWKSGEFSEDKMKMLAMKLQALVGEEIFGVVDLIKEFESVKTGTASYSSSPELLKFDLYTLSEEELTDLWTYCNNCNRV